MSNAWNRAEHYRNLAEECRRLAETTLSTLMRHRFWQMAEYYNRLADAEGPRHTSLRRLAASIAPTTVRPLKTRAADPREARKWNDAEPRSQPINLLSFLEAENMRLRQTVVELSLNTSALRKALKTMEVPDRDAAESVDQSRFKHADPDRTLNNQLPILNRRSPGRCRAPWSLPGPKSIPEPDRQFCVGRHGTPID